MERILKQTVYLFIFLGILGFFIFYFFIFEKEEMVVNTPILILPSQIEAQFAKAVAIKDFDYDIVARIRNPNTNLGSPNINYEFKLFDKNDLNFRSIYGNAYILPGQTRYLLETPIKSDREISKVDLMILSVEWEEIKNIFQENISLTVSNREFILNDPSGASVAINGILLNNSDFDLDQVEIIGFLYNERDETIGLGKTNMRTLSAHGSRAFEIKWFDPIREKVVKIDTEAYTNLFENSNFIRKFGTQEKFQEF